MSDLKDMNMRALEVISQHLKPVNYAEDTYIIREGEPLNKIIFIRQGIPWTYVHNKQWK